MDLPEFFQPDGTTVVLMHYAVPGADGNARVACTPQVTDLGRSKSRFSPWLLSADVRNVSCPLCKRTASFQEAWRRYEEVQARG